MRKILVTSALPYANGPIHLGHLVEYIQTDIWARYQKMSGHDVYYFCADDTHGTPIMLAAKKEGIAPEDLIERVHQEHYRDLTSFEIEFTNYYSTNSTENEQLARSFFKKFQQKGHIYQKEIEQTYCEHDKMFLPDRFIKGTCPKCKNPDQYGDSCEVCGSTYSAMDLLDAVCSLCGNTPVSRKSKHYFFRLADFEKDLLKWYSHGGHVNKSVAKKMQEWFSAGLHDWDISRDGPYFGFKIPGEENKFFYVWLDAPIGYIASSLNYFAKNDNMEYFENFWQKQPDWEIYHFIGKDIMYFHTLFWPAQLIGADFKTPNSVFVHGFLTINGEKMSKSKGTFILASIYLEHLDPGYLRYYYASKLNDSLEDLDLNLEDFMHRINSDLLGNFINIFSRSSGSLAKKLDNQLGTISQQGLAILENLWQAQTNIQQMYEDRMYSKLIREITSLGDTINKFINDQAPWNQIKNDPQQARDTITTALNGAKILATYLKPILPDLTKKIEAFLNIQPMSFANIKETMENHQINDYKHLLPRIDKKQIAALLEQSKTSISPNKKHSEPQNQPSSTLTDESIIDIQTLNKVDLRIGNIEEAKDVPETDKLIQLTIDLGNLGKKNVFAGIKKAYLPDQLINQKCVVVTNLEPRKMKFGVSEAMVLATGKDETLSLVVPHKNARPGDKLQ